MPWLGGFQIVTTGWSGRSAIYVDFQTEATDRLMQLYVNRRLAGVTLSFGETRVIGQVWDAQLSAAAISLMLVDPSESFTDFGDLLETKPWNRYTLSFTIPDGYAADTHHFDILKASHYDSAPTEIVARVPYVGPRIYTVDLPGIPALPMPQPADMNARSRWQDWRYRVIPRDDASPFGNAGSITDVTIPALIYPAEFVFLGDGNRFAASPAGNQLTISYSLPA